MVILLVEEKKEKSLITTQYVVLIQGRNNTSSRKQLNTINMLLFHIYIISTSLRRLLAGLSLRISTDTSIGKKQRI